MSDKKVSHNIVPPDQAGEFAHWQLPDVGDALPLKPSNLFGHKPGVMEAKEAEEPVSPPTMAEIESIREQAEQEGFAEGKEQGIAKGLEEGRLQGLEQGHSEGFSQGLEQGREEGLQQAATMLARFDALLAQFEAPLALLDTQIEESLLTLVGTLARNLIAHELKTHPEHILAALRQGIDALPLKEQKVNLRLHPEDMALVKELYGEEQLARNRWTLEADPGLNRGDCVVDSQRSQVDMRLETRLEGVFANLEAEQSMLAKRAAQQQAVIDDRLTPAQDSEQGQSLADEQTAAINDKAEIASQEGEQPSEGDTHDTAAPKPTAE
ncbi:flagellar assembly protein FliH [Shewanella carassii]|uniref:Flagellar assembly protein FliH n=1 Tax=Shewanella carassii TaxID=1987584 RepID=A0ABQ1T113_9GAMM|nr:flagellar assembly protein FliH [Shewanella carassii]GGE70344.1 flagellar assembly protein FliH [Shewanella carassii]